MKLLFKLFVFVAVLYLILLAALYTQQRKILYMPPSFYLTPAGVDLPEAQEVFQPGSTDNVLGWWLPPASPDAPVIMFFHGNGSAIYSNHQIYRELQAQGMGVFAVGYPGYPGTLGKTTQDSVTSATQEGYDYLLAQGVSADKIVYYGTSLGAGVAAQLSKTRKPALLIMEAPFTSAAAMAQLRFPMFPSALLTKDKFRSDVALEDADIPMLWLHGTSDRVIPMQIGKALYEGYLGPKSQMVIPGGTHTDIWYRGGRERILSEIRTHASP